MVSSNGRESTRPEGGANLSKKRRMVCCLIITMRSLRRRRWRMLRIHFVLVARRERRTCEDRMTANVENGGLASD